MAQNRGQFLQFLHLPSRGATQGSVLPGPWTVMMTGVMIEVKNIPCDAARSNYKVAQMYENKLYKN